MKRGLVLAGISAALLTRMLAAGEPNSGLTTPGSTGWISFWNPSMTAAPEESTLAHPTGWKSPRRALLFSAVVPGAGELYAGTKLKAVAFFAVEVGAWVTYASYHKKGQDKETEFQDYADAHWSESEYWDALAREAGLDPNDIEALRDYESGHYSHSLHREKDQQYYEMIGKYDQFNVGWDDTDTHRARDSKRRLDYEDMRAEANSFFKNATTGATVAMINHLLSAMDAAWTTVRHNNKLMTASVRATGLAYDHELVPALGVQVAW